MARTQIKNGSYMSCQSCCNHIAYYNTDKPPKFAMRNGWCIDELPKNLIDGEVEDILELSVARIQIFPMYILIMLVLIKQ